VAPQGQFGNVGRFSMRGPGVFLLDTEVHKQFRMPYKEGHMFQFRFEAFNVSTTRTGGCLARTFGRELRTSHQYVHGHAPDPTRTEVLVLIRCTLSQGQWPNRHPRPLALRDPAIRNALSRICALWRSKRTPASSGFAKAGRTTRFRWRPLTSRRTAASRENCAASCAALQIRHGAAPLILSRSSCGGRVAPWYIMAGIHCQKLFAAAYSLLNATNIEVTNNDTSRLFRYRVPAGAVACMGAAGQRKPDYNPQKNTENLVPFSATLNSPDVRDDQTVTFRLKAPPPKKCCSRAPSSRAREIRPVRTIHEGRGRGVDPHVGPLTPDMYIYHLLVDGVRIADPNNTIAGFTAMPPYSQLVVHGSGPAYYDARNVPHGAVTRHVYHSSVTNGEREIYVYTPPAMTVASTIRCSISWVEAATCLRTGV